MKLLRNFQNSKSPSQETFSTGAQPKFLIKKVCTPKIKTIFSSVLAIKSILRSEIIQINYFLLNNLNNKLMCTEDRQTR